MFARPRLRACVRACVHEELGGGLVRLFNSSKCPSTLACLSAVALFVYILQQQQLAKDSPAPRLLGWGRPPLLSTAGNQWEDSW